MELYALLILLINTVMYLHGLVNIASFMWLLKEGICVCVMMSDDLCRVRKPKIESHEFFLWEYVGCAEIFLKPPWNPICCYLPYG